MSERAEELALPNAVVARIIKDALPEGMNLSKESRQCFSRGAGVFILYMTSVANVQASEAKRKTVMPSDCFAALKEMELHSYVEPLEQALQAYKEQQKLRKASKQRSSDVRNPASSLLTESVTSQMEESSAAEEQTVSAAETEAVVDADM